MSSTMGERWRDRMCDNCLMSERRPGGRECDACARYRQRTGSPRPLYLIERASRAQRER